MGMRETQADVRNMMYEEAMALSQGSRRGAARLLGVTRQAVQQMAKEHSGDDPVTVGHVADPEHSK